MKYTHKLHVIFVIVCLLANTQGSFTQPRKKLVFDDFFKTYTFRAKGFSGLQSMNDGLHYTLQEENGDIAMYSYETGEKVKVLLPADKLAAEGIKHVFDYRFSPDEQMMLLTTEREAIYRRSFTAQYYVYKLADGKLQPVSGNGAQQLATFSPDSKKIGFVRRNNLFVTDLQSGMEKQVTMDGEFNKIINGAPDWVYEEEFEYNQAFEWSPDSKYIAFCRFDESRVKEFSMTMYKGLKPELSENAEYPEIRTWKYPKAGEDNSIVSVLVYYVATGKVQNVDVGVETDQYIPRIKWTNIPNRLCIYRLNRLQNKFELLMADVITGKSFAFYTEPNKYYIDEAMFDQVAFLDNKAGIILLSERDGFAHIYIYDLEGKKVNQVTKGNWDVTQFIGYDQVNDWVYFQSAEESPIRRCIYAIHKDGSGKKKLSTLSGTNEAEFSNGYHYYINTFSNSFTPPLITLHKADGKQIRVLEDNAALKTTLKDYNLKYKEQFSFTTSENVILNGYMIKPAIFDKKKKYPVFMTQYSGPNSQEAGDSWSFGWEYFLAQNGYIVVCVDGRGTAARGEEFRKMTYLQLGKYETMDQVETAKYMGKQGFVNPARIGIFGWSYGGFMVTSCLTRGADYFKMGIAVAPVTNWRYYDNIYTERFMRTPRENPKGYEDNSPINHASELKGKLLLIHGTADDNVHFQNSIEFAEALVQANKQFDMQVYNNRNHGIRGGNTTYHLYTKMYNYILENL